MISIIFLNNRSFLIATTDEERQRTDDLYLYPIFVKLNDWTTRYIPDIQLGFFILIRGRKWREITN
jgi:hypothetical protein